MHSIRFAHPSDATSRFIRFYAHRQSCLRSSVLMHPVPARSVPALDFEFGDDIEIYNLADGSLRRAETPAVIGVQSYRRVEQLIRGEIESFVVFFQPAALSLIFGLPASAVTNADHQAHGVLGRSISVLQERFGNCRSFQERVRSAEEFFTSFTPRAPSFDALESAANAIVRQQGVCRIDALVRHTGLSSRTFQRNFRHAIGLSPKAYARIVRFESALRTKAASPHVTWTEVAYQYGYHDQMHMIHDFQRLSAETPSGLLWHLENLYASGLCDTDKKHLVL